MLRRTEAFPRSAHGQETTARALAALSTDDWRVFHDVRWPGRRFANLDHVLVGPSGVFVVDTLSWSGHVEVRGGVLRHNGTRRDRSVTAVADAALAVSELVPGLELQAVKPVLCVVSEGPLFGWSHDVMVCSAENVVTFLTSRPRMLSEARVHETAGQLATSLRAADAPTLTTVRGAPVLARAARSDHAVGRGRRSVATWSEPAKSLLALASFALVALLFFQLDIPARLGDLGARTLQHVVAPIEPIGTTVQVSGGTGRPDLEVRAGAPVLTASEVPGIQPQQGHRLVAVPVTIANTGEEDWDADSDVRAVIYDADARSYSSDPAYERLRAGRALPDRLRLRPGRTVRGLVVFEVPRGTRVARVQLRIGPGLPTTARWAVLG